jgi:hypothetical protein
MAGGISIKFDISGMRALERMREAIPKRAREVLKQAGNIFVEELSKATSRFTRSAGRWDKSSVHSEKLMDSFKLRSTQWDTLQITSSSLYWDIQESGDLGRVVPNTKKAMLVPFTGVSREYIDTAHAAGRTFITKKEVIVEREGKKNLIALGKFMHRINIKPKRYVMKAEIKATPRIEKLFREAIANI